jgi:hypothetical protein
MLPFKPKQQEKTNYETGKKTEYNTIQLNEEKKAEKDQPTAEPLDCLHPPTKSSPQSVAAAG